MILRRIVFFLALLLGLAGSQVPEFAQQYRQRLGGHVDELNRALATFDAEAARLNLSREDGIARLVGNPDRLARQRGEQLRADTERAARLEAQLRAFEQAGPFWRLATFARQYEPEIVRRTADHFEPAVPVTGEGLIAAVAGFFLGWLSGRAVIAPIQRRQRRRMAS